MFLQVLFHVLISLSLIASPLSLLSSPVFARACSDVHFIFARGSGETVGSGTNFSAFKSSITSSISSELKGLKYHFYDLGSSTHGGHRYPAVAIDDTKVLLGSYVSAGKAFEFGRSVEEGIAEIKSYISEITAACPSTKFVLAGYSQGGMVVSKALPELDSNKIIYAATFGDPKLYLPEGFGFFPPACQNLYFSNYRQHVPDCRTNQGILKALKPYQSSAYIDKIGAWCNEADFMCGSYFNVTDLSNLSLSASNTLLKTHLAYSSDGSFNSASKVILGAIKKSIQPAPLKSSSHDAVILIDSTGSMQGFSEYFKDRAIQLAQSIIKQGGRVSLYDYRDLIEDYHPQRLCDLGCSLADFRQKIDALEFDGGEDSEESLLSALKTVMNDTPWRKTALKSVIAITDDGFHSPDRDGTSLKDIVNLSLKIDPVSIYPVVPTELQLQYQELATMTGGKVFDPDISTFDFSDQINHRPDISFNQESYLGVVGDSLDFALNLPDNTDNYQFKWDLDADGSFETITQTPQVQYTYKNPTNGFVQVQATDSSGRSSLMSAELHISAIDQNLPTINNSTFDSKNHKISFSLPKDTVATYLTINDAPMGLTTKDSFYIQDLPSDQNTTVTLIPVNKLGLKGNPTSFTIKSSSSSTTKMTSASSPKIKLRAPNTGAHL